MTMIEYAENRGLENGWDLGMRKGRQEEKENWIRNLLHENFPEEKIAKLASVKISFVKKMKKALKPDER